jgi:hypothetical protein
MEHTKESIIQLLNTSDKAVERAIIAIYNRQTFAEQSSEKTVEHNGEGFSGFDAEILSSFAKQILKGRSLSYKQIAIGRKKMVHYTRQLLEIAAAKEQVREAKSDNNHVIEMSEIGFDGIAHFDNGYSRAVYSFVPVRDRENEVTAWTYYDTETGCSYAILND